MGMARTFQNLRLFSDLSILDNVKTAMHSHLIQRWYDAFLHTPRYRRTEARCDQDARAWLEFVGFTGDESLYVTQLPYGAQRQVEIARALATSPKVLLLDEPAAGLNHNEVVIGPRRLRDVDAAPFRAAINEAGLKAAMNAYHEIDGLPVTSSPEYLIDLLRDELGMGEDGIVVADYYAVDDLEHFHRVAVDRADAARQALTAGLDVELPNYEYYRTVPQQVRDGLIDEAVIDRSVRRVLRQKVRLGLFENPFVDADAVGASRARAMTSTLSPPPVGAACGIGWGW